MQLIGCANFILLIAFNCIIKNLSGEIRNIFCGHSDLWPTGKLIFKN